LLQSGFEGRFIDRKGNRLDLRITAMQTLELRGIFLFVEDHDDRLKLQAFDGRQQGLQATGAVTKI